MKDEGPCQRNQKVWGNVSGAARSLLVLGAEGPGLGALPVGGSETEGSLRSSEVVVDRRRAWRRALNWVRYRTQAWSSSNGTGGVSPRQLMSQRL